MDPQRGLPFDPLLDYGRDPYLRSFSGIRDVLGHTPSQQAMALATNLSSGQGFYTVESLEGATSLPLPKPAPSLPLPRSETHPASVAVAAEREALLRLDAQTRALLADRENLDARARLLAAEREALLRAPGEAEARARALPDGLQPLDARARALSDGLQPLARVVDSRPRALPDGLQPLDARSRALSVGLQPLDTRTRAHLESLQHRDARARVFSDSLDGRSRVPPLTGGFTVKGQDLLPPPGSLPPRDLGAGAREGLASFLRADSIAPTLPRREGLELHGRRQSLELRGRGETLEPHGRGTPASLDRVLANGKREGDRGRAGLLENSRVRKQAEKGKPALSSYPPPRAGLDQKSPAGKTKPPPDESEGLCAVCKINCFNAKTLKSHVAGKKHKLVLEKLKEDKANTSNAGKAEKTEAEQAKAVLSEKVATSIADRKRANDEKVEAPASAKRPKVSASADASNTTVAAGADAKKGNENGAHAVCELCNISCTSKMNLDSHLKGKRHAARLMELKEASSGQK